MKGGENLFYVTSLDGSQVEPLIGWATDFNLSQSVDGTLTVASTVLSSVNNPGFDVLASESIVSIDGLDFRVKQFAPNAGYKHFTAVSNFFDHNTTWVHTVFGGSHTVANHAQFALGSTGWAFTVDNSLVGITNYIPNFGNDNAVSLVQKLCKYHQCEFVILPGKRIHFAKQIGPDNDHQYRYKHNISDVILKEDTSKLRTYIRGYGKDGLMVEYTSPNASIFGIREAEPIKDERFTNATALLNYIKLKLQDEPELAIESRIPELTSREIGERVWLFYEPLNIAMQTRILKQNKTLVRINGALELVTNSVVFGNTLIKDAGDDIVEQQMLLNEAKEEITETIEETVREVNLKFQETDTKIVDQYQTITSEYSASITANAQVIRSEMNQKETTINNSIAAQYTKITAEYNSAVTQTAQSIRSDVTASITAVNGSIQNVQNYASSVNQKADIIQSTVNSQQTTINGLGTRVSSAESSITQQATLIASKVSQTEFTGRTVSSLIMQDPLSISLTADKLNLNGAVVVNGSISGATRIDVSTDINLGRMIRFNDFTAIYSNNGNMTFDAYNNIDYQGRRHTFWGTVDFSNATVIGLPK